jgi:hypothetical protein
MSLSGRDVSGDIAPQSSLGTFADTEDAEAVEGMTLLGDVQLARYGGKHDKLHSLKAATERLDSATLPRHSGYTGLAYKPAKTSRTHPTLPIRPILPKFRHL